MSKALYAGGQPASLALLTEVQSLRRRVAELEAALQQAEDASLTTSDHARTDEEVIDLRTVRTAATA